MISVVIPVLNEAENIQNLYMRLKSVLEKMQILHEIIFIDDASTDATSSIIRQLRDSDDSVKIIRFSRIFGHQIALTAGIRNSRGDYVVTMDGDLQDPPEFIEQLYEKVQEGYDVVYAVRRIRKGEAFIRKIIIKLFYHVFRKITTIDVPLNAGDFRILNKRAIEKLKEMHENEPFLRGMVSWLGLRQTGVEYVRARRYGGKSKYSWAKLFKLAMDGITSFSVFPLRIATYLGLFVSIVSFVFSLHIVIRYLQSDLASPVPGWASTIVCVLFLGGIQLFSLGLIGEYIARIYIQTKKRPLYIVSCALGFEETEKDENSGT